VRVEAYQVRHGELAERCLVRRVPGARGWQLYPELWRCDSLIFEPAD
jgi:hypothetical protein